MTNVVDFKYSKNLKEIRDLDLKASHAALSHCLHMINLNDLPENHVIKSQIKKAMKLLEKS